MSKEIEDFITMFQGSTFASNEDVEETLRIGIRNIVKKLENKRIIVDQHQKPQ